MKHLKHRSNNPLATHLQALRKTLFLLFTLLMSVSAYGQNGTITVNHSSDVTANDSHCTLREAVALAHDSSVSTLNGCTRVAYSGGTAHRYDTINFASNFISPQTITLGGNHITITKSVMIDGSNRAVTVDANKQSRIFFIVGQSTEVTVDQLTLTNGKKAESRDRGGAIFAINTNTVTVRNSTLTGNTANFGGAIFAYSLIVSNSTLTRNTADRGGAISAPGTLIVSNSTLSNNTAGDGGAIQATIGTTVTVSNSTLSGNTADDGGAIDTPGTLTVNNSTLSNNTANNKGGAIDASGTVEVKSSVLLGNTARLGGNCYLRGNAVATGKNNLWESSAKCGNANGSTTTLATVLETDNSGKAKVADNGCVTPAAGGCVKTIRLLSTNNPAINTGLGADPDQRGIAVYGGTRDIGAYELNFNGVCGGANGTPTLTVPTANLCGAGTASSVTTGTSAFNWSCNGTNGGSTASCSAPRQFTVSTNVSGVNGSISPANQTVAHGGKTTFTVSPDTGYRASVTGCGGTLNGSTYTTGNITGACTVSASFSQNSYIVTGTAGANGGITPASQTVNHGDTTTFTVSPDTGYSIDSVTGCGGRLNVNTYTTGSITGACTVSASFSQNSYTVTGTAGGNGRINPASRTVSHGATTSFTVTPDTGYSIDSVTGCGGRLNGSTYTTGSITGACTVSASFSQNSYIVTGTAGANGSITPANRTVNHGATTTFTVTPDTGYSTDSVTGCGGTLNGNTYTTGNITGACTVTARFGIKSYPISVTVAGLGVGNKVVLQNNGGDDLTANADGEFTFSTTIDHGKDYAVTVLTQPTGQRCTINDASSTTTAPVSISVQCVRLSPLIFSDSFEAP